MSWLKALFAKGDDGIRHWTRLKFQRSLQNSESPTSFECRLSAAASTIEARNAMNGITAFTMGDCILEAAPIAIHSEETACDILEEYMICRATGRSTRQEWVEFEFNRGFTILFSDPSPLFKHLKTAVARGYRDTGAIWDRWLTADNLARLSGSASTSSD